jgi:L-fucose mutarotase
MLTGIPKIISPELMKTIMEMGHGDELVIADGNFPILGYPKKIVHCEGLNIAPMLDAILQFYPLDTFVKQPVVVMDRVAGDSYIPEIWQVYETIIRKHYPEFREFEMVSRFAFYERTQKAYAVVTTSEMSRYANLVLKKGLVSN